MEGSINWYTKLPLEALNNKCQGTCGFVKKPQIKEQSIFPIYKFQGIMPPLQYGY